MADINSVYITGGDPDGVKDAFSGMPAWASQQTLEQVEKYLRKTFDIQQNFFQNAKKSIAGTNGKMPPETSKKFNDELDKAGKGLKKNNEEDEKKRKRDKLREKSENDSLTRGKKTKTADEKLNVVLAGIAGVGLKVLGVEKDYVDVYDSLYKSGINVLNGNNSTADGFEALNQMVNETGLRLQTLQKVAEKYSNTLNAVGFSKFSKAVGMSSKQLLELGYSSEAQAELMGVLIESESGYMDIRNKSSAELAADAIKLGGQLNKLSQTVGLSREQLQENLKATARNTDSTLVEAAYGKEAAERVAEFTASFKDQNIGKIFQQMAAAIDPIFTQAYKDLQDSGLGDLGDQLGRIAKESRSIDPAESQKRIDSLMQSLSPSRVDALRYQIAGGNQAAQAAAEMINGLKQQGRNISQATSAQNNNAQKTESAVAGLQTEIEKLSAAGQRAFFPMIEQVNLVTSGLKSLNEVIDKLIGSVNATTRSWIGAGLALAGIIASLFVGEKILSRFFNLFSTKGTSAIEGILNFGKSAAGVGSTLTKLAGGLLKFLGVVGMAFTAFQLGSSIGESIYEMIGSVESFTGLMDKWVGPAIDGVINAFNNLAKWFGEVGTMLYDKIFNIGKLVSDSFDIFIDNIKRSGQMLMDAIPWLKTLAGYISQIVDQFRNIVQFISDFANNLKTIFIESLKKFANKLTFGLFEDTPKATTAPATPVQQTAKEANSQISIPKSPAASTVVSPSAVPAEAPVPGKSTDTSTPSTPAAATNGIDRAVKSGDINSLLVNQGLLLEQILTGTNALVSVNKDILKYARNSA